MCLKGTDLSVWVEFQEDTKTSFGKKRKRLWLSFGPSNGSHMIKILSFYLCCFFQEVFVWRVFLVRFWPEPRWESQGKELKLFCPLFFLLWCRVPLPFLLGGWIHHPENNIHCREDNFLGIFSITSLLSFQLPCQSHKIGLKAFEVSDGWSLSVAAPKQASLAVNHFVLIFFLVVVSSPLYNLASL